MLQNVKTKYEYNLDGEQPLGLVERLETLTSDMWRLLILERDLGGISILKTEEDFQRQLEYERISKSIFGCVRPDMSKEAYETRKAILDLRDKGV